MTETSNALSSTASQETEETLIIIKPEVVSQKKSDEILARFVQAGFNVVSPKIERLTQKVAEDHYSFLRGKSFFPELIEYMTSGDVLIARIVGKNAVSQVREMVGTTDPLEAEAGTIRKDFGTDKGKNAIHASDSPVAVLIEVARFYSEEELEEVA